MNEDEPDDFPVVEWHPDVRPPPVNRLALGPTRAVIFEAFPVGDGLSRAFEFVFPLRGTLVRSFVSVVPANPLDGGRCATAEDFDVSLSFNGTMTTHSSRYIASGRLDTDAFILLSTFQRDWIHADVDAQVTVAEGDVLVATFRMRAHAAHHGPPSRIGLHFAIAPVPAR